MGDVDLPGWSQVILALVAVVGGYGAHRLNQRGQVTQARQQQAANELAMRAQGFDEMESLVDRLRAEIARVEARSDRESIAQAARCRASLSHFVDAFTILQRQVVDETAQRVAIIAQERPERHVAEDHPEPTGP